MPFFLFVLFRLVWTAGPLPVQQSQRLFLIFATVLVYNYSPSSSVQNQSVLLRGLMRMVHSLTGSMAQYTSDYGRYWFPTQVAAVSLTRLQS
jgi:hypothetical protein